MGKSPVVIAISAICVVACVAAITVGVTKFNHHGDKGSGDGGGDSNKINSGTKAIQSVCQPTKYKQACESTLTSSAGNTSDPKELVKAAFKVAKEEVAKALEKSETIKAAKDDARAAEGLEICKEVVGYAINDLERSVESMGAFSMDNIDDFLEDMRIWVGGAITYQEVCFEGFENSTSDAGQKLRSFFNVSRELSSNALNIITGAKSMVQYLDIPGLDMSAVGGGPEGGGNGGGGGGAGHRRLLGKGKGKGKGKQMWIAGETPPWVSDPKRKVMNMPISKIKPDAVVAQDGSGQYKTIGDAVKQVPLDNESPFIIYIKAGTYKEYVEILKKQNNVVLVGDGVDKTIITGNKNFAGGINTFRTATVGVLGDGFMARDIRFENTAGPEGHQAVALRVTSDLAVIHNCKMAGHQDTLYALRGRQFYRDCEISGTIDFIFGDAQAVFQNCKMIVRKPGPNQQCMVTAQGRTEEKGPGGFVFQGCSVSGEPDYMAVKDKQPAYLGRPWKEYSRTIFMTSNIDTVIAPPGWTEWRGNFALDTLFYAEYQNKGPGADTSQRVKWKGIKTLTPQQAEEFTPAKLYITPEKWIPTTGVPFAPGMFSGVS